jgi:hypothetical protein
MDPGTAIFVIDLQDANKKLILKKFFFLRDIYIIFQRLKVKKKSQRSRNQGFSYYFCLVIEGSGSGSIPLTNGFGSGSRRPKNIPYGWDRCGSATLLDRRSVNKEGCYYLGFKLTVSASIMLRYE